jgi:ABC-2 type transport system ATP-binding protein
VSTVTISDDLAVRVRDLHKSYGSVEAVRGIDLDVGRGEIVALLGPNGAGKTTTVEILEGYRERTSGGVSVLGHDPARGEPALKARIGIVLQASAGERYLTAREIVAMYAGYYPRARQPDELLELVGLAPQARTRIKKLSGGQRRRLDLAIALAGDPELLFLDEPTTGFDPSARRSAWSMVRELARLGKTVLLTTTSWTRRNRSPTASRCWSTVVSSPRARRPRSSPAIRSRPSSVCGWRLVPPTRLPALDSRRCKRPEG